MQNLNQHLQIVQYVRDVVIPISLWSLNNRKLILYINELYRSQFLSESQKMREYKGLESLTLYIYKCNKDHMKNYVVERM